MAILGAAVVSGLARIYGRYAKGGTLPAMLPGVLFQLPVGDLLQHHACSMLMTMQAGLSAVGGLSANYASNQSQALSWLTNALGMIKGQQA